MEHIVQFGIGIDDNQITKIIEEKAANQIIGDIKTMVCNVMFKSYYHGHNASPKDQVSEFTKGVIDNWLESHSSEIIDSVSEKLVEKLMKTKAVKELKDKTIESFEKDG